jgi:cytochrome P450
MIVEESMLILIGGDETTRHVMTGGLVELCGVSLPDGAQVLLFYPSANRDASVFAAPDEFDVSRDPNPHLAFGALSHHFCPLRASNFILGIESMPVRFRPGRRLTRS